MSKTRTLIEKTETYVFRKDIIIDIVSNYMTKEYSAWIEKKLMLGLPMARQSYKKFVDIVEANATEYLADYMARTRKGE